MLFFYDIQKIGIVIFVILIIFYCLWIFEIGDLGPRKKAIYTLTMPISIFIFLFYITYKGIIFLRNCIVYNEAVFDTDISKIKKN